MAAADNASSHHCPPFRPPPTSPFSSYPGCYYSQTLPQSSQPTPSLPGVFPRVHNLFRVFLTLYHMNRTGYSP